MYIPLTLIPLSAVSWPTSLPVPKIGQAVVAVPSTSPTPTPMVGSFEKRESVYSPLETHEPILEVSTGNAADALKERASAANGFDSLLCETLKVLKGGDPASYTSLLESCTSLIDSSPHKRTKTLKERNVVENEENLAADVDVVDNGSGKAVLGRSEFDQPDQRGLGTDNVAEKR